MNYLIILLLLVSCKSLTKDAEAVNIMEGKAPSNCRKIGEVSSEAYFGPNTGKNLLRNRAAELDANMIIMTKELNTEFAADAYKCL